MSAIRRGVTFVLCALALAACQEDGPRASGTQNVASPDFFEKDRLACEKQGGHWGAGASDKFFLCYRQTRDANKECSKASDCDGLCLARSRTCAPYTPLYGCQEVLTDNGQQATQCIE